MIYGGTTTQPQLKTLPMNSLKNAVTNTSRALTADPRRISPDRRRKETPYLYIILQHKSNSKDKTMNHSLLTGRLHMPGRYFCRRHIRFREKKKHAQSTKMTRLFWESADVNNYRAQTESAAETQHNGSAIISADTLSAVARRDDSMTGARRAASSTPTHFLTRQGQRLRVPATRQHKHRRNYHNNINRPSFSAKTTVWFCWEEGAAAQSYGTCQSCRVRMRAGRWAIVCQRNNI